MSDDANRLNEDDELESVSGGGAANPAPIDPNPPITRHHLPVDPPPPRQIHPG
jgi:hypothetical protein